VAFDTTVIDDGIALNHAATILDEFHEVYGVTDPQVRVVLVMRQLGTAMGINDAMWERYPIDDRNKNDSTKTPAQRNPYWASRPDRSPQENSSQLEPLTKRGVIVLVCNVALTNVARAMARATDKNADEVVAEFRKNLIPGATLVPSGVFGMVRAQNAGCAYMRAS
jgi:intracellular sulfur oxidation DsrE/DsrF family protein